MKLRNSARIVQGADFHRLQLTRWLPQVCDRNVHLCEISKVGSIPVAAPERKKSWGDSVLLFLAELLETRIGAQWVPQWIESKKSWGYGRWIVKPANIGGV